MPGPTFSRFLHRLSSPLLWEQGARREQGSGSFLGGLQPRDAGADVRLAPVGFPVKEQVMNERKRWLCTDCEDTFLAEKLQRCPMCYGARVIGKVPDEPLIPDAVGKVEVT